MTHAILPEDVCAYRDLSLEDLATILTAAEPSVAARAVGDLSEESVRRARRWRREAMGEVARQAERLLPEARAPSPWWQRALEAFTDLVAWRHWQWRQTGHFVTGLLGLFRHGRPPWVVARSST